MSTVKENNDMDLIEPEILRRGGRNTQNYYKKKKKNLHDPDSHEGVITQLEPDPGM